MKKIIHFHFDTTYNIGDAAVVFAIRDLLKNKLSVSKYTYRPILYLTKIDFYKDSLEKLEKSKSKNKFLLLVQKNHFFLTSKVILIKTLKAIKGTNETRLASFINKHDVMIVGGGGLYAKWTLPFNTDLIQKIKIPIIIFGAGYNKNFSDKPLSKDALDSVKIINQQSAKSSVRDTETLEFLKSLDCQPDLIGDPAITLQSHPVDLKFDQNKIKIGLNIAYHNWSLQEKYTEKIIETYISLIEKIDAEYPIEVYYLKHSLDEQYIAKRLKERLPQIIICDYDPYETKYVYEHLDLVISMMLHSSIFAYASGTTFINIAYDEKNYAFMRLIGSNHIFDVRNLSSGNLYKKVKSILDKKVKDSTVDASLFKKKIENFVKEIALLK